MVHLESLLNNLPDAIPIGDKYSAFLAFVLDPELVDKTGHEIGALSEQFKRIFGWQARTTGDGILSPIPILQPAAYVPMCRKQPAVPEGDPNWNW